MDELEQDKKTPTLISEHRVLVLVAATILIAILFTGVGLFLYNKSGTAQLDLSRPDYEGVSDIVKKEKPTYEEFSATGAMNEATLKEFDNLFKKPAADARSVDAFGGDPLALDALGINEPITE